MDAVSGITNLGSDSASVREARARQEALEIQQQALEVAGAIKGVRAGLLFDKAKIALALDQSTINRDYQKLREQFNLNTKRLAQIRATTIKGDTGDRSTMSGKNDELLLLSQASAEQIRMRYNRENFSARHKAAMNKFQSDWDIAKSSEDQGVTGKAGFTGYQRNKFMDVLSIAGNIEEGITGLGGFGKTRKGEKRSGWDFLSGNKDLDPGTGWGIFT